jgi:hypothetical protein
VPLPKQLKAQAMDKYESLDDLFARISQGEARRRNPFKFLDAYGPKDRAIFFGRDEEIRDLYARFYRSRVVLVYGESGTGKTSLIECGLRNEIPPEEALFVVVRVDQDPFQAVKQALEKIPGVSLGWPLEDLFKVVIEAKSKTLVLVFDQFEEFFLFQSESLRRQFSQQAKQWLDSNPKLRIIIALRQEYLAYANELHQHWPGYQPAELWLRRLSRAQAEIAITGPCALCGLELEEGLPEKLLADISPGGEGVELPILQVVLDTLARVAISNAAALRRRKAPG